MAVFYQTINNDKPKYLEIIGTSPGLAFRPRAENDDVIGVLKFKTNDSGDVQKKVDDVDELLKGKIERF